MKRTIEIKERKTYFIEISDNFLNSLRLVQLMKIKIIMTLHHKIKLLPLYFGFFLLNNVAFIY